MSLKNSSINEQRKIFFARLKVLILLNFKGYKGLDFVLMSPFTRWLMVTELFHQGAVSIASCCGGTTQLSVLIYWAWCTWPRQSSQTSPKSAISGSEKNWTADGKRLVLLCTCRQPSLLSVSDSLCCSRHHGPALHTPSPHHPPSLQPPRVDSLLAILVPGSSHRTYGHLRNRFHGYFRHSTAAGSPAS